MFEVCQIHFQIVPLRAHSALIYYIHNFVPSFVTNPEQYVDVALPHAPDIDMHVFKPE